MDVRIRSRKRVVDWLGHADCSSCSLAGRLCQQLPRSRQDGVPLPVDSLTYGTEMPLYSVGDEAPFVFAVREGLLKLTQIASNGMPRIVRFLRGGEVGGLEALAGGPYRHTAVAIVPTLVCRIPVDMLQEEGGQDLILSPHIFQHWLRSMDDADKFITQLSTGPAPGRVARCLLHVLSTPEQDSCVALSREDMSALLSVTMETVSRTVADFKRQGLLQEGKGRFNFDREGLMSLAAQ